MKIQKKWVGVAALYFCSFAVFAVPMTTFVGNVTILGNDYAVSSLYDSAANAAAQSFNALNPTITFTTQADATAAVTAINAAFLGYVWNPGFGANSIGTRVAFSMVGNSYSFMTVAFGNAPSGPFTTTKTAANFFSFAQFARISANVPEPGSIALIGLGLTVMGFRRRQIKAAA